MKNLLSVVGGMTRHLLPRRAAAPPADAHLPDGLRGYVTGGTSACFISASITDGGVASNFLLVQIGRYPLYDVVARIVDVDALQDLQNMPGLSWQQFLKTESTRRFGEIAPGQCIDIAGTIRLGESPRRRFNIFYTARNGEFVQYLRLCRVSGQWLTATRVQRGEEILYESVPDGYPEIGPGHWDVG